MENKYLSVTQFAKLHSMDSGRIRLLISQGRIPAVKIGNQWAIPSDAQPPTDRRVKNGRYVGRRKGDKPKSNTPSE